jgi:hypothetical protein
VTITNIGRTRRGSFLFYQWLLPVIVIGIAAPIGLIAAGLALDNFSLKTALDNGELWLVGGNSLATSACLLMALRRDRIEAGISALLAGGLFYYCWATVSTQTIEHRPVDLRLAVDGGWIALGLGVVVSLVFTLLAWSGRSG